MTRIEQHWVTQDLRLSWDEIHGIPERAVRRGLARRKQEPVPVVGVDEKAFAKGHKYFTIVNDLARNRVLYVAEDRKQESLDGFWKTLTEAQRQGIQAVAMDMWDPMSTRSTVTSTTPATRSYSTNSTSPSTLAKPLTKYAVRNTNNYAPLAMTGSQAPNTTGCTAPWRWTPRTGAPSTGYATAI